MTYQETIGYLDSFINYEKRPFPNYSRAFKLERVERLLALLGDPQKGLKVIHITGTKGKGSTAVLISSILKEAGLRVGLYTSPHLSSFRERIRVNNEMIEEETLAGIVSEIKPHLEDMRKNNISFFEVYTAIAFFYFKKETVDFAVVEVGLGGRLDATNVIDSIISVITPISLEHTRILGSTLFQIASEKAGIIKKDSTCISSPQESEALEVIEDMCRKKGAHLYLVGRDIHIDRGRFDQHRQRFNIWTKFSEYPLLELKLIGEHQIINAATAIGAIDALRAFNLFIPPQKVGEGIRYAQWPGRMEVLGKDPLVIADGAQNAASSKVLVDALKRHFNFRNLILVLGISKDKDIEGICKTLSRISSACILTRADNPRAQDPHVLKRYINDKPAEVFLDSADAMRSAYSKADKEDLILITGSLFLVGEIREKLKSFKFKDE